MEWYHQNSEEILFTTDDHMPELAAWMMAQLKILLDMSVSNWAPYTLSKKATQGCGLPKQEIKPRKSKT